jgi:predicted peroxiredoxin
MATILVHVTNGPEHPTRAALAFLAAKAAIDEGHKVTMFLAGDAVQLMREGCWTICRPGTGNPRLPVMRSPHLRSTSRVMVKQSQGVDPQASLGNFVEMAMPNVLTAGARA